MSEHPNKNEPLNKYILQSEVIERLELENEELKQKLKSFNASEQRELLIDFLNYHLDNNLDGTEANWIGKTVDDFIINKEK